MKTMKRKLKRMVLNWLMSDLFNAVTEDDVIKVVGNNVMIGHERISDARRQEIVMGARAMLASPFWKLLNTEMEMAANRRLYNHSTSDEDIVFGKAMLYNENLRIKKVEALSRLKVR